MGFSVLDINGGEKVTIGQSVFTTTATGNVDDLDFGNADLIRFNNASLATLRGLKAGADGQRVTIVSVGAGEVDLSNQDAGDVTASSRIICFVTSGKTPLAAGIGTATCQYDGTAARWRLISHEQGAWINVAYSGGNFTGAASMTWTVDSGDVTTNRYYLKGTTLFWELYLVTTSVSGTPASTFQITLPNGLQTATGSYELSMLFVSDNGTRGVGFGVSENVSATQIGIVKLDGTTWSASPNNTSVAGPFIVRVI
jgi:hypothetical protein